MHDVLRKPSEILNGGREITEISEHPVVLCPLSYANDEPVDSILEAATLLPDVVFVFTGNAPAWVIRIAPENITFSGYISNDEYWTLLQSSCGVLALTNRDLTMQRAGYEALLAGKPHVTSDFEVLRDFYGQAAIYTQPSGEEIAKSLLEMIQNANELCHAAVNVLAKRSAEQQEAIHALTRENVEWRHGG
jgi:glycosyltransferase involved in cell wall biosynthesis